MRVIAGLARGRKLKAPIGSSLRPTSERVREAVFSSLVSLDVLDGARVLDLFAGTGALGIEALSRGAATATFVDSDPAAVTAIEQNLASTGFSSAATVVRAEVMRWLQRPGLDGEGPFDIAFVDPPYAFDDWPTLLLRLPATLAVLESGRAVATTPPWLTMRSRRHGDTVVTFARRN